MPIGDKDSGDIPAVGSLPLAVPTTQGYIRGAPQPQVVGASPGTWQHVLTNALPWARIHGMPGETEVPPGMSVPLNDEERAYLMQMLQAGA